MSEQTALPLDKRLVIARDIPITFLGAVFLFMGGIVLVSYMLQNRSEATSLTQATPVPSTPTAQLASVDEAAAEEGRAIYQNKCASCHTFGGGRQVGPDLKGVTALRDRDWLFRWIIAPDVLLASDDPIALQLLQEFNNVAMPNMVLSEAEVYALLAYLEMQDVEAPLPQPVEVSAHAIPVGDSDHGESLFSGATGFQNGAPSCMSCHSITGSGALGGGTLGPDLTNVYTRYGDAGLEATLKSLPFPTMQSVYTDKPLTDEEMAHLYAFFIEADRATAEPVNFIFVMIGLGGFIVLGVLSQLLWNKRLTGVRKPLVGR